jgi:hypothetical protein
VPLLLQFFPRHILLPGYNRWIGSCPFPAELHMVLIEGTEKLTYASAMFEAASRSRGVPAMPEFDPTRLPNLARAVEASPYDAEGLFEQTIRTYLSAFPRLATATDERADYLDGGRPRVRVKALREPAD